jgi:lysophospholipase L1-like esterase
MLRSVLVRPLCALTLAFGACIPVAAATIEIASPTDYQVFQRRSRLHGVVRIAGKLDATVGDVQFRISGKPLEGQLPSGWQPLGVDRQKHTFGIDATAPAGGWYRVEVRMVKNGATLAERAVEHVGVGEVFVVAGQSNAANSGEQRQKPGTDRVVSFDGSHWAVANDPQRGASGEGGTFIPSLGDAMTKTYGVPVGFACVGVGGTSVREWLPKGDAVAATPTTGANVVATGPNAWACTGGLFNNLAHRIGQFGPHGFRAILWHQGESDAKQPAGHNITPEQYRQYLVRLIQASRSHVGWRVPWFVAQASYHVPSDPGTPELRAVQKSVAANGTALEGPNTDELGGEYREANGQGVHFNGKGLQKHGELWAKFVGAWLDAQLAAERSPSARWKADIERFEDADQKNPPPQNAILFIGSSGIALWKTLAHDFPGYTVINRGFGGSEIADSVYYADRIVVPYKPRLIVFRAGVNDIAAGKSPEQVAADFKAFASIVQAKLPSTKIVFMALNPSIARWGNFAKESKTNELIKSYIASGKNLEYVDVVGPMLGPDGKPRPELYGPDRLHNSREGYKLWISLVLPHLGPKEK